jgi:putative hemolysin
MPISGLQAETQRAGSSVQTPSLFPGKNLWQRLQPLHKVQELYRRAQQPANRSLLENVLHEMGAEYRISDSDLERIPATGAVVVVANHPFGVLDGAILGALLERVRPDVKIMTNVLLAGIPELQEHCIFVDPFAERGSAALNRRAMKQALTWLRGGGMLAIFPAGEVSHLLWRRMEIADSEWNSTVARLIRLTGSSALPLFFEGRNSVTFQTVGLIHPRLRTAWLLNEFLQQKHKKVEVRVGSAISAETISNAGTDRDATGYLRWRTYLLAQRGHEARTLPPALRAVFLRKKQAPIAAPLPTEALLDDLQKLGAKKCFDENKDFSVYVADPEEIPNLLQEVGRLREVTFRAVGEGTGKSLDLDRFDPYYKHVLLWSKAKQELVGAYRLGLTEEILPRFGPSGLYTSTLFRYDVRLFDHFGPALELGRSFVRPEYQRQYAPLLMLWRGIGRFLASNPHLTILFGAVSISSRYNRVSRELIVRFFRAREEDPGLRKLIAPRRPFRPGWIRPGDCPTTCTRLKDLDELTDPIGDVESDGKGVPILIKQYAKLGGRLLSFNVDRDFSNVLDGLVVVDLKRTDPTVLERYVGKDGILAFQRYHGIPAAVARSHEA